MKVGDMVVLSAAGDKIQMNYTPKTHGAYGLVCRVHDYGGVGGNDTYKIRWFGKNGKPIVDMNHYRWELKYKKRSKK